MILGLGRGVPIANGYSNGYTMLTMTITIYSRSTCVPCLQLKKYFDYKGLKYDVIDADREPEKFNEIVARTGFVIVPQTIIGDEIIVGANIQKIAEVVAKWTTIG